MKIICILLILPFCVLGQSWQWAQRIGSNYDVVGAPICNDNNGNLYVWGGYRYQSYFQTDTLTSNGFNDMFICKYDLNGNEVWIKNIGGKNPNNTFERFTAHPDKSGDYILAVGSFYDTLSIDGNTIVSAGGSDIFIAKFNLNGDCIWLKQAGGSASNDIGNVFTVDLNNDIFFTGSNSDTAVFDSFIVPPGNYFAKYDISGNCLFAERKYSGLTITSIKPMSSDLILAGTSLDNIIKIDTISLTLGLGEKAFLAKIDSSGSIYWLKTFGSYSNTIGGAVDLDHQKNIYYTGYFEDSAEFNSITIYHSPGTTQPDFFLAKLDSSGNTKWVQQSNSSGMAHGTAVYSDEDGNVYLSGDFSGTAQFGSFSTIANTRSDFFLARYNTYGDCLGIRHFGVAISMNVILVDNNANVCVGGQFIDLVSIGTQNLSSTNSINPDVFIAKCGAITGFGGDNHRVNNNLLIYANPMEGKCTISVPDELLNEKHLVLSIFDSNGKLIQQRELERFEGKVRLNLEAEAKGVYTAVLSSGSKSYSGKIVFE